MGGILLAIVAAAAFVALGRSSAGGGGAGGGLLPTPGVRHVVVNGRAAIVRVPKNLKRMRTVLYGHGFGATITDVDAAIGPAIEALADPPVLVIPQLGPKSELGDLATIKGLHDFLLAAMDRDLNRLGPIDVVAHSGGYQLAAAAQAALPVRSIALLDALYGEVDVFVAFARRAASRRIVSIFGPTTKSMSKDFIDRCRKAGVSTWIDETPAKTVAIGAVRRAKASALATSVFHTKVPAADAAAAIEAIGA